MPQDAFHIRRLAQELNTLLVHGKVNRVSQVDKDELTLIIYTGKQTVKLILSTNASNARVCLSETEKEPAPVAPNFCMLLRKHIVGAEILEIRQKDFERIIEIELKCTGDFSESNRVLICELMGKYSNVILCENGVILGALKSTALDDNLKRILFSGAKYCYPAPQDKLSVTDGAGIEVLIKSYLSTRAETGIDEEDFARFIFENVSGFALSTARELVKRLGVENFAEKLKTAFEELENTPCIVYNNGVPCDFFAFKVDGGKETSSLCKAEDEFYSYRERKKGFDDKKRKLESALRGLKKKQAKRMQDVFERLKESENADENRIKGELLTANLYRLEKGLKECTLENWYEPDCPNIKIKLDETLSPQKNAQKYFKIYNKQKRAKEILEPMLETEKKEVEYVASVETAIRLAEDEQDLKEIQTELIDLGLIHPQKERAGGKKKEIETPFRAYLLDGFRVFAGRNNIQNDRLVRSASPNDIWLHTQKYHSSHVLILRDGKEIPDSVILKASELCAYYSDGRDADKIPVDYCEKRFVKKPSKSKAGFVVYTDYKTILVKPNPHKDYQV